MKAKDLGLERSWRWEAASIWNGQCPFQITDAGSTASCGKHKTHMIVLPLLCSSHAAGKNLGTSEANFVQGKFRPRQAGSCNGTQPRLKVRRKGQ